MRAESTPHISVVVPAYNEEERLPRALHRLRGALRKTFESFEIIIVDDGSSDGTSEVARNFSLGNPGVSLIALSRNRGKGYAVRRGVLAAAGEYVLFTDADLSTPVREVRRLIAALEGGCDIAIGSRARPETKIVRRQPAYRVTMGKIFNLMVRLLVLGGIADTQCGFKCFKRATARAIFSRCVVDGFSFDVEALFVGRRLGLQICEIGVLWRNHPYSRVHPVIHSVQMMLDLFRIRLNAWRGLYLVGEDNLTTMDSCSSR